MYELVIKYILINNYTLLQIVFLQHFALLLFLMWCFLDCMGAL
jgi:hypothetical protein